MNRILYESRCKCKEEKRFIELLRTKKRERRKEEKLYIDSENQKSRSKTFPIKSNNRSKGKEEKNEVSRPKKRQRRKEGKLYPNLENQEIRSKTFQIKYEKRLSTAEKFLLNSFQNKYIYYAIDDILDSLKLNRVERENMLTILYSPILSLQNNFAVNFFDIWISEIYIEEISKVNKFLNIESQIAEQFSYITLKFFYQISVPVKKQEPLW